MEVTKKIKVYCGVPSVGNLADFQPFFWRDSQERYGDKIEFIWPKQHVRRVFHDFARNEVAKEFLDSGCDILAFIDSDVVPPVELWDLVLKQDKWDVAGAPYPIFLTPNGYERPQVVFTVYDGHFSKGMASADVPKSGSGYVDGLATGCMLIKRHILEKLSVPYFEFIFDETTRNLKVGEDLGFCHKVNNIGYKFYVEYDKVCKHYKHVDLLEVNNYAMEYSNRSIERYDSLVRDKVAKLKEYIKKLEASAKKPSTKEQKIISEIVSGRSHQASPDLALKKLGFGV